MHEQVAENPVIETLQNRVDEQESLMFDCHKVIIS